MSSKTKIEAQNPLIIRCHRLMDAFAKSDDERDFYLDRMEGFIVYADMNKNQSDIDSLEKELGNNSDRYCLIPKLTFYETKKIMEGFVNEKVYDIDTKEKLLDIIQSKDARANFIEFVQDHHSEFEKWQQYYQERGRIRIIEWLRRNHFNFVFEEDLELSRHLLEKLKEQLFQTRVGKDIAAARKVLASKAKTYYSTEALNPRPKRGRPPKQAVKQEIEPQVSTDIYTTVPPAVRPFLYTPEIPNAASLTFSSDFESRDLLSRRTNALADTHDMDNIAQKLAAIRTLSNRWTSTSAPVEKAPAKAAKVGFEEEEEEFEEESPKRSKPEPKTAKPAVKSPKARIVASAKKKPAKPVPKKRKAAPARPVRAKAKAPEVKKRPKRIIPRFKNTSGVPRKAKRVLPKAKPKKQIKAPLKRR